MLTGRRRRPRRHRRHRRLQGGRGVPPSRRRRRARGAGPHRGRHPLRGRGHLLGPGLRSRPRPRSSAATTPSRTPGWARPPTWSWSRPATARSDRLLRRRDLRRPADRHAAGHPGAGAGLPGDAHRDVGAPGRPGEPRHPAAAGRDVLPPEAGRLAGGDIGAGRLAEPEAIVAAAARILGCDGVPPGRHQGVVTAGGTREPIDPVRFIGNRCSGKQGHAVAAEAAARGAEVTLVTTTDPTAAIPASRWCGSRPPPRWRPPSFESEAIGRRGRHGGRGRRLPSAAPRPSRSSRSTTGSPRSSSSPPPTSSPSSARRKAGRPDPGGFAAETTDVVEQRRAQAGGQERRPPRGQRRVGGRRRI